MCITRGDIGLQVTHVRFVNTAMAKASIVCTFINDHGIFHIIASVTNYSDYGISTRWTQVEIVFEMFRRAYKWLLREQQSVDLIIHSIGVRMIWSSHCLFSHLALIHVPRTLIVVAEGDGRRDD